MKTRLLRRCLAVSLGVASTGLGLAVAKEDPQKAQECQTALRKLNEAGVLRGMQLDRRARAVVVVVDRQAWRDMTREAKTRFVENVVCMITLADPSETARVEVRDDKENRVIGRYNGRKLDVP